MFQSAVPKISDGEVAGFKPAVAFIIQELHLVFSSMLKSVNYLAWATSAHFHLSGHSMSDHPVNNTAPSQI